MAACVISEKIVLNFSWQGPTHWRGGAANGGEEISAVSLVFQEAKTRISVFLPDNISPTIPTPFKFSCYRGSSYPTTPDSLRVTIEQIKKLTLTAIVLDKSPRPGPAIMDEFGKVTQQEFLRRTDQCIPLKIPEVLEKGQTYRLIVSSDTYLHCSAELVKETISPAQEEDLYLAAKQELFSVFGSLFLVAMGVRGMELATRLALLPSGQFLSVNFPSQGEVPGVTAIKEAIDQIDKNKLIPLLETVRCLQITWTSAPSSERTVLEQKLFKLCCESLGAIGIANMMRSNLMLLMPKNVPQDVEEAINEIVTRFTDQCMSRI